MSQELVLTSPGLTLVYGPEGAGGGELVERLFAPHERLRAAELRRLLGAHDAASHRALAPRAWELLREAVAERLDARRFTVVEAEAWSVHEPSSLHRLCRDAQLPLTLLALTTKARVCRERAGLAPEEGSRQAGLVQRALSELGKRRSIELRRCSHVEDIGAWRAKPLACEAQRAQRGPFDVVGDVHGCAAELRELLGRLGYQPTPEGGWRHPERTLVFLGDLVDRGPACVEVLRQARASVLAGDALCVLGNHDDKLLRVLRGKSVKVAHGLQATLDQLAALPADERGRFEQEAEAFLRELPDHLVLDEGSLVVAHGGLPERLHGRQGGKVRSFALYGDTTGKKDAHGLPERLDWGLDYRGAAAVLYGHTPVVRPRWRHGTACVDQGAVFGGALTAARWPERSFVSVPALRTWTPPRGGFRPPLLPPPA